MDQAVLAHRIQFGFTIMFHYLFPILTMGLGTFMAGLSTAWFFTRKPEYKVAARFWAKLFAVSFALGVVTGIPLEFEFGTNWSRLSMFGGAVFGQALPLEGVYAFFLESGFLGLYLFGEDRVSPLVHWLAGVALAVGSLLSGYFIVATDAWLQHPVGYVIGADGNAQLTSFWAVLCNPFAGWQYAHTINGALVAASFVFAAVGAFYLLLGRHTAFARQSLAIGLCAGLVFSLTQAFPTGDLESSHIATWQPLKLATMEGLFHSERGAPLDILGMPDSEHSRLIDPIEVPDVLSFLAYGNLHASVAGLDEYPRKDWPPVELTYYCYHIMVGLGTVFIGIAGLGVLLLWRRRLFGARWFLWIVMCAVPFPFIANEAGWVVTEVGRQPWLVYGLLRTANGTSTNVATGETVFTTLGFAGIYAALALLFLVLGARWLWTGPNGSDASEAREASETREAPASERPQ
jgi:cytochrome d ubiquinol oxidase subunit I